MPMRHERKALLLGLFSGQAPLTPRPGCAPASGTNYGPGDGNCRRRFMLAALQKRSADNEHQLVKVLHFLRVCVSSVFACMSGSGFD